MRRDDESRTARASRTSELVAENQWLREEVARLEVQASQIALYEEQRTASVRRFQAVVANNQGAILLLNPEGIVVELVHSILGYSPARLAGHSVTDLMPPESAEQFRRDLELVVRTAGGRSEREYCIRDATGRARWLEGILSDRLEDPAINAIVFNCRDVTATTTAESQLELLAAIVEFSGWAIVPEDFDGRILIWNSGARDLYGYTAKEMAGKNIATLLAPGQSDDEAVERQRIRAGRPVRTRFTTRRRKDGTLVEVELRIAGLRDKRGDPAGFVHIAHAGRR